MVSGQDEAHYMEMVRTGRIHKGTKGGELRMHWRMALNEEMDDTPLQDDGYLLRVELNEPERREKPLWRIVRVATTIHFQQLNVILCRALGWEVEQDYSYKLWGEEDDQPVEALVRDVDEDSHCEGPEAVHWNWKCSKNRKLSQVFEGSRIWPEVPERIDYTWYVD